MSEQMDGQQPPVTPPSGVLMDPLSVRNTDTGNMKRMAAENASHSQARKTIKLKPLAMKKGGVAPSDLTAASMTAAVSASPAAAPAAAPAAPTPDADGVGEQATVAMERITIEEPTQKLQKSAISAVPVAAPASSSHSSVGGALPGSKQTIKLRPSTTSVGGNGTSHGDAIPAERPASAQTIKLSPKSATPSSEGSAPEPTPQSIRDVQTVAMARQTIRLVPKKAEVTSSAPVQPKPSDPTINLQPGKVEDTAPSIPRPSDPTTRLAPTQMMPAPKVQAVPPPSDTASAIEPAASEGGEAAPTATKPKIGIKHHSASSSLPPSLQSEEAAHAEESELSEAEEGGKAKKDEPSLIFTIAAILSLLTIGFLSFFLFSQFDNHWWGGNINLPGLERLTGPK